MPTQNIYDEQKFGALVFDFDNTMTQVDVCDAIMQASGSDWKKLGALHDGGDISHAELNRRFASILTQSPSEITSFLERNTLLRPGVSDLFRDLQEKNIPVFIVSGGWDVYIENVLRREGGINKFAFLDHVSDFSSEQINVFCNRLIYENGVWSVASQSLHSSFDASPCKKSILQDIRKQVKGRIVFVGDGKTDFDASEVADIVFARDNLAVHCENSAIPYYKYNDFRDVASILEESSANDTRYPDVLKLLRSRFFLNPDGSNIDTVVDSVASSLAAVVAGQGDGPIYPMRRDRQTPIQSIRGAFLDAKVAFKPGGLLETSLPQGLQGGVKAGHPLMVKNIIPTPSTVFLSAHLAASLYAQNGVTGEDSAEAVNSELKISAVLSDLVGYDREKSAGIFTFGGTGTNMYGIKMGLAKACPDHALEGIKERVHVVGSKPAHYSHVTATDWLGIGQNNYLHVKSHIDQTTDMEDLEQKCRNVIEQGGKLACIIGSAGTTSNMAIDDFRVIQGIRDKLVSDYGLQYSPHIHADSVVGWPYLYFSGYDFDKNPLGFSEKALQRIEAAASRISTIRHADSFGVDFHKTGYMPYNASMVICKSEQDVKALGREAKIMTPLFHDDSVYNPGKVTLETSRSSATMLAAWLTMCAFGQEGYQVLIGHAQEMAAILRDEISERHQLGLFVGNQVGYGTDVFVRCYPPNIDVAEAYSQDLKDDAVLARNSRYTTDFFKWLTDDSNNYSKELAISKTSAAFYTESGQPFVALRLYMLSPYATPETVRILVKRLAAAKVEYDMICEAQLGSNASKEPYKPLGVLPQSNDIFPLQNGL